MIITIDGPSGTGKTTVAKLVAEKLHFAYFDTGAMYRALTWFFLERNVSPSDLDQIEKLLQQFSFHIEERNGEKHYFVAGSDVTKEIRKERINSNVSVYAALKVVRDSLWKIQRAFGAKTDAVFEGRDIGTVVFPQAEIKIFLTARPEVRAHRRLQEMIDKYPEEAKKMSHEKMMADLMRRDEIDSTREVAPLKCPEDAYVVDTSDHSIHEVVRMILEYKVRKVGR